MFRLDSLGVSSDFDQPFGSFLKIHLWLELYGRLYLSLGTNIERLFDHFSENQKDSFIIYRPIWKGTFINHSGIQRLFYILTEMERFFYQSSDVHL